MNWKLLLETARKERIGTLHEDITNLNARQKKQLDFWLGGGKESECSADVKEFIHSHRASITIAREAHMNDVKELVSRLPWPINVDDLEISEHDREVLDAHVLNGKVKECMSHVITTMSKHVTIHFNAAEESYMTPKPFLSSWITKYILQFRAAHDIQETPLEWISSIFAFMKIRHPDHFKRIRKYKLEPLH